MKSKSILIILYVLIFGCSNPNKNLIGDWICTESINSESTKFNRFFRGYIFSFTENNKFYELRDSSSLCGEKFKFENDFINIKNRLIYKIHSISKDSMIMQNTESDVMLTLIKLRKTSFLSKDSTFLNRWLIKNVPVENIDNVNISYYFDSIQYFKNNPLSKIFNRTFQSDSSFRACGEWWGVDFFRGNLILHLSDYGSTSSFFQVTRIEETSIEGFKHEEFQKGNWVEFKLRENEVLKDEVKSRLKQLKGIWHLDKVEKPSISRINKTLATGFLDGGGGVKEELRFSLEDLITQKWSVEFETEKKYIIRNGSGTSSIGNWFLTKDNKLICFDNKDIDYNCFLYKMNEDSTLFLRKEEDILINRKKINSYWYDFTTEDLSIILKKK